VRLSPDAAGVAPDHPVRMRQKSYAVWWQEADGPRHAGKLQLGSLHLLLSGNGSGRVALPLDQIVSVSYHRGELHIERKDAAGLDIGNLDGPGALLELSEALAA
jgi:hypothetical protein